MNNMNKHVSCVYEGKKPFNCDICDFSCSQKSQMKTHIESVHDGKQILKMWHCDSIFKQALRDWEKTVQ